MKKEAAAEAAAPSEAEGAAVDIARRCFLLAFGDVPCAVFFSFFCWIVSPMFCWFHGWHRGEVGLRDIVDAPRDAPRWAFAEVPWAVFFLLEIVFRFCFDVPWAFADVPWAVFFMLEIVLRMFFDFDLLLFGSRLLYKRLPACFGPVVSYGPGSLLLQVVFISFSCMLLRLLVGDQTYYGVFI